METLTGYKGLDAAYARMAASLLAILIHPGYDPTTTGPDMAKLVKRMSDDSIFQMLSQLQLAPGSKRNILQEAEDVLRAAWPLGFGDKTEPKEGDAYAGVSEADATAVEHSAAYAIEHPYGEEGREFQELLVALAKTEGRELTLEEKLRTVRAFNKAVHDGQPQTVSFDGENGYLIVGTKSLCDKVDAIAGVLGALVGQGKPPRS